MCNIAVYWEETNSDRLSIHLSFELTYSFKLSKQKCKSQACHQNDCVKRESLGFQYFEGLEVKRALKYRIYKTLVLLMDLTVMNVLARHSPSSKAQQWNGDDLQTKIPLSKPELYWVNICLNWRCSCKGKYFMFKQQILKSCIRLQMKRVNPRIQDWL